MSKFKKPSNTAVKNTLVDVATGTAGVAVGYGTDAVAVVKQDKMIDRLVKAGLPLALALFYKGKFSRHGVTFAAGHAGYHLAQLVREQTAKMKPIEGDGQLANFANAALNTGGALACPCDNDYYPALGNPALLQAEYNRTWEPGMFDGDNTENVNFELLESALMGAAM